MPSAQPFGEASARHAALFYRGGAPTARSEPNSRKTRRLAQIDDVARRVELHLRPAGRVPTRRRYGYLDMPTPSTPSSGRQDQEARRPGPPDEAQLGSGRSGHSLSSSTGTVDRPNPRFAKPDPVDFWPTTPSESGTIFRAASFRQNSPRPRFCQHPPPRRQLAACGRRTAME